MPNGKDNGGGPTAARGVLARVAAERIAVVCEPDVAADSTLMIEETAFAISLLAEARVPPRKAARSEACEAAQGPVSVAMAELTTQLKRLLLWERRKAPNEPVSQITEERCATLVCSLALLRESVATPDAASPIPEAIITKVASLIDEAAGAAQHADRRTTRYRDWLAQVPHMCAVAFGLTSELSPQEAPSWARLRSVPNPFATRAVVVIVSIERKPPTFPSPDFSPGEARFKVQIAVIDSEEIVDGLLADTDHIVLTQSACRGRGVDSTDIDDALLFVPTVCDLRRCRGCDSEKNLELIPVCSLTAALDAARGHDDAAAAARASTLAWFKRHLWQCRFDKQPPRLASTVFHPTDEEQELAVDEADLELMYRFAAATEAHAHALQEHSALYVTSRAVQRGFSWLPTTGERVAEPGAVCRPRIVVVLCGADHAGYFPWLEAPFVAPMQRTRLLIRDCDASERVRSGGAKMSHDDAWAQSCNPDFYRFAVLVCTLTRNGMLQVKRAHIAKDGTATHTAARALLPSMSV